MSRLRVIELSNDLLAPTSLDIRASECVCISGPSGAGKTALLRAIADLEPHDGKVVLDNVECASLKGSEWRRLVGLLPAESAWWYERVDEHFDGVDDDALSQLGFDHGMLERRVTRLSTGERQRLALLRLLTGQPRALLLDEPTASLDPKNTRRAEQLIAQYRKQHRAPVLWISHDPRQIRRVSSQHFRLVAGQLKPARTR
ncbi:MAG: ATP-binding cassette domain-containing protein [Acidiferrobacterales bacterium]